VEYYRKLKQYVGQFEKSPHDVLPIPF